MDLIHLLKKFRVFETVAKKYYLLLQNNKIVVNESRKILPISHMCLIET